MVMCVHDPVDGQGADLMPPPTKWSRSVARDLCPHSVYTAISSFGASPRQSHIGQKEGVCARPSRVVGGLRQIPPPMPSAIMPHYDTHDRPCAHCVKILTKQTDCTCWPCSLPLRQLLGMHTPEVTYKSISNFNYQRSGSRAAVEEWKEPPACGLPLTLDHLMRSRRRTYKTSPYKTSTRQNVS